MSSLTSRRPAGAIALVLLCALGAGCVDNGHAAPGDTCAPLVKFSNPEGVTPQAVDGVVSLPVEASTCDQVGLALWAWSSEGNQDRALDVFETDAGTTVVSIPVTEEYDEPCRTSSITVALVDDGGDIVDQDRTFLQYAVAR